MLTSSFIAVCATAALVAIATATNSCKQMTTFNAFLMVNTTDNDVRRPEIIKALDSSTDDFMCLQEVWFEKDLTDIVEKVKGKFPHHYSKIHASPDTLRKGNSGVKDASCNMGDVMAIQSKIVPCIMQYKCSNPKNPMLEGMCILQKCGKILKKVSEACVSCLTLHASMPFQQAAFKCVQTTTVDNRLNGPGLLVLSKAPMRTVSYKKFFPENRMSIERGYIHAVLDDGKQVACTHLSTDLPYFEYDLTFGSYANQSIEEIKVLNKAFGDKNHILIGDFNTGPVVRGTGEKNLMGDLPKSYEFLRSLGYRSLYLEQDGRCTFCSKPNVIDHVLVKPSQWNATSPTRLYENPPLSDHYGVRLQVCDRETKS